MGKHMIAQDTRSRVADAINMDTLSCPANFDEVRAMRGAGQAYDEAQKGEKNRKLGSPFVQVWAAFALAMSQHKDCPNDLKAALREHLASINTA